MQNSNTPSLGALLRQRTEADENARKRAEAEAERQRKEKEASDRACIQHFYDNARQAFTEQILATGHVTPIRVESYGENGRVAELLKTFRKAPSTSGHQNPASPDHDPYYPLWVDFNNWAHQNGLEAKWEYDHDGVGIKSWYFLTVKPV